MTRPYNAVRLGDRSKAPVDSHNCTECSHNVIGPSIQASSDVLINMRPAVRKADRGVHQQCCGGNNWQATEGADHVLVNRRPVHRLGDATLHCGGKGYTIDGSANVLIGNTEEPNQTDLVDVGFRLLTALGRPLAGESAEVYGPNGWRARAQTDKDGKIIFRMVPSGVYTLVIAGRTLISKDLEPMG